MPFRHVVMFRWTDDVDVDHVAEVRAGLDTMPTLVPTIRNYVHGSDVGISEGSFDYAVVADFDDVAGYETYRDHPEHIDLIERLIAGRVDERAALQMETEPG